MGLLKTIVEQLQARSGVTPVTHDGVTAKPSTGAGCTPVTPVTPVFNNVRVAISGFTLRMVSLPRLAAAATATSVRIGVIGSSDFGLPLPKFSPLAIRFAFARASNIGFNLSARTPRWCNLQRTVIGPSLNLRQPCGSKSTA